MLDLNNCSKQLAASMKLAVETKTEANLIAQLLYLHEWYGEDDCVVKLHSSLPSDPGFIDWSAHHIDSETKEPKADCFYNGGLVFSKSCNEWSIHS